MSLGINLIGVCINLFGVLIGLTAYIRDGSALWMVVWCGVFGFFHFREIVKLMATEEDEDALR